MPEYNFQALPYGVSESASLKTAPINIVPDYPGREFTTVKIV